MRPAFALAALALLAPPALGYVHVPPQTLQDMVESSTHVRTLAVKQCDPAKGVVVFDAGEVILAERKSPITSFKLVVRPDAPGGKAVLDKLNAGATAVLFTSEWSRGGNSTTGFGYCFVDGAAFCVDYNPTGGYWLFLRDEPGLSVTFHGPAKELPTLVKDVRAGRPVKVPTKAPAKKDDTRLRGLLVDEARRRNRPEYPTTPLPTAWGKPARGLQAGVRANPAVSVAGAAAALEVVVRNLGTEPVIFTHLELAFAGDGADGVVTVAGAEVKGFNPPGTRLSVRLSPGDAVALAVLPVYRPGEGKGGARGRVGANQVGAVGVAVRPGDAGKGADVDLATGYLDVVLPAAKK